MSFRELMVLVFQSDTTEQSPLLNEYGSNSNSSTASSGSSLTVNLSEAAATTPPPTPAAPPDVGPDRQDFQGMGGGLEDDIFDRC